MIEKGPTLVMPQPHPVRAGTMEWIPLRKGVSFRPLHFAADGYSLQLRVEPGTTIARHRHTGEVHAFNIVGHRELIETGEIAGPGDYVYEPAGTVDSWRCLGGIACVVQITLKGRLEYLDDEGAVVECTDACSARGTYLAWCRARGAPPDPLLVPDETGAENRAPPAAGALSS